jgi:LemA protein
MVRAEEDVKKTWADLQATYQRRLDLIPSLVSVVKGSANFESQTLEELAAARSKAQNIMLTSNPDYKSYQNQEQSQAVVVQSANRIIALVERYPDLKSTKSYLYLQVQLEGTERRVKVARNDFNSSVADFNKLVRRFPSDLVANLFKFKPKEGFQSDIQSENPPEVKF